MADRLAEAKALLKRRPEPRLFRTTDPIHADIEGWAKILREGTGRCVKAADLAAFLNGQQTPARVLQLEAQRVEFDRVNLVPMRAEKERRKRVAAEEKAAAEAAAAEQERLAAERAAAAKARAAEIAEKQAAQRGPVLE